MSVLSTRPSEPAPPPLSPLGLARWAWRQLTSMRVALILLFLLALAAVPGSLLPQRPVNPPRVQQYVSEHPTLAPILDRLQMFDVFGSVWFSAIYLLVFVSLAGCVIPRSRRHWQAMRARPPAAPRNLSRLPVWRRFETDAAPSEVLSAARATLRRQRFRVDSDVPADDGTWHGVGAVRAEKGFLRETGNLAFHLALIGVLVAVAAGSLYGYRGSAIVVEGDGFANTLTQYDDFDPGALVSPAEELAPFSLTLTRFTAQFQQAGEQQGQARDFDARVRYRPTPVAAQRGYDIRVNHPLAVGDADVYLLGNGYAPVFSVRDTEGHLVFQGPVPFLPRDADFSSTGVVKVPDARPRQLGFQALFLPTAVIDPQRGPVSAFPDPKNPAVFLVAWRGDLGLDAGVPQSVYELDTTAMQKVTAGGKPLAKALSKGETMTLPDGLGSISYDGYREWARLEVRHDPGAGLVLASATLALAGLMLSLGVRRRRIWVRAAPGDGGRTVVEVAGLARTETVGGLEPEVAAVARAIDDDVTGPSRPAPEQEPEEE